LIEDIFGKNTTFRISCQSLSKLFELFIHKFILLALDGVDILFVSAKWFETG
jgi:hypothetical protein